jgi:hypothetical protein
VFELVAPSDGFRVEIVDGDGDDVVADDGARLRESLFGPDFDLRSDAAHGAGDYLCGVFGPDRHAAFTGQGRAIAPAEGVRYALEQIEAARGVVSPSSGTVTLPEDRDAMRVVFG